MNSKPWKIVLAHHMLNMATILISNFIQATPMLAISPESGFLVFIFLPFRHKNLEFRINCFKFTHYFAKISRLIFIIIRDSFVTYAST